MLQQVDEPRRVVIMPGKKLSQAEVTLQYVALVVLAVIILITVIKMV
jgi:hypothetical protein